MIFNDVRNQDVRINLLGKHSHWPFDLALASWTPFVPIFKKIEGTLFTKWYMPAWYESVCFTSGSKHTVQSWCGTVGGGGVFEIAPISKRALVRHFGQAQLFLLAFCFSRNPYYLAIIILLLFSFDWDFRFGIVWVYHYQEE